MTTTTVRTVTHPAWCTLSLCNVDPAAGTWLHRSDEDIIGHHRVSMSQGDNDPALIELDKKVLTPAEAKQEAYKLILTATSLMEYAAQAERPGRGLVFPNEGVRGREGRDRRHRWPSCTHTR